MYSVYDGRVVVVFKKKNYKKGIVYVIYRFLFKIASYYMVIVWFRRDDFKLRYINLYIFSILEIYIYI